MGIEEEESESIMARRLRKVTLCVFRQPKISLPSRRDGTIKLLNKFNSKFIAILDPEYLNGTYASKHKNPFYFLFNENISKDVRVCFNLETWASEASKNPAKLFETFESKPRLY